MADVHSGTKHLRYSRRGTLHYLVCLRFHLFPRDTNKCSVALEAGIFISQIVWLIRTRQIRKEAKAAGKTFDDIAEEHSMNNTEFRFAERSFGRSRKSVELEAGTWDTPAEVQTGM